jgi:hypothetical protein
MHAWTNHYQNKQKKQKVYTNQNAIETAKDIGGDVVQKVNTELIGGTASAAMEQIGLAPRKQTDSFSGEINLTQVTTSQSTEIGVNQSIRPGIVHSENIITQEQIMLQKENQQTQAEIRHVLEELKLLATTVKSFEHEVAKVTLEAPPKNAGVYHKHFFEWLISMIRNMRKKVCESRNWLAVFNQKKRKRGYWYMFKKHGTSFALSDERGIATATG